MNRTPINEAIRALGEINGIAQVDDDEQANDREVLLAKLSDIYDRSAAMADWLKANR